MPSPRNARKTIYAPGSKQISSWMGIDYEHRWIARKCFEAAGLFFVGDMISQYFILWRFRRAIDARSDKLHGGPSKLESTFWRSIKEDWSFLRSVRAALFGAMLYGPLRLRWSRGLDKVLPFHTQFHQTDKIVFAREDYNILAKRLSMEYFIWLPSILCGNLFFMSFLDGRPKDFLFKSTNIFPSAYLQSFLMFASVQGLCFGVLPPWAWVIATNVVTISWGTLLSYQNFKCQQIMMKGTVLPPDTFL